MARVRCPVCGDVKLAKGWGYVAKRKGVPERAGLCPHCVGKPNRKAESRRLLEARRKGYNLDPETAFEELMFDAERY